MKTLTYSLIIAFTTLVSACNDGVPTVEDPHNPKVDGATVKPFDFLKAYCNGKQSNETCQKVRNAMSIDAVNGKATRF